MSLIPLDVIRSVGMQKKGDFTHNILTEAELLELYTTNHLITFQYKPRNKMLDTLKAYMLHD